MTPALNMQPKLERNIASLRAAVSDDRIKNALPLTEIQAKAACLRIMNPERK
jgi:hypothetical protein